MTLKWSIYTEEKYGDYSDSMNIELKMNKSDNFQMNVVMQFH